jgi:hypothetical protein
MTDKEKMINRLNTILWYIHCACDGANDRSKDECEYLTALSAAANAYVNAITLINTIENTKKVDS